MAVFVVAYDLKKRGQNYDCITEKLKALPYCHAQGSVWLVEYGGSAASLTENLMACLDDNDRLFVDEVTNEWTGYNMPVCGKWLNDRGL